MSSFVIAPGWPTNIEARAPHQTGQSFTTGQSYIKRPCKASGPKPNRVGPKKDHHVWVTNEAKLLGRSDPFG